MLTVMRYELWESQMHKFLKPEMTPEETLEVGKNLAEWANHATGSGKGFVANIGGNVLFGPKLTQSKINRLNVFTGDPAKTIKTFSNWNGASPGEKAVAWTRLSGATQYALTLTGFLAVNQGLNMALGSKQKVNWTDPDKSDFLAFKIAGMEGYIPGMHSEIRVLSKILATAWMSRKQTRGESRDEHSNTIFGDYVAGKLTPTIGLVKELGFGQNWRGQPVPWSSDKGTKRNQRLTWTEFAGEHAPIPLEGPIGYFYNHLKQNGASSMDAMTITKGLIMSGVGATGVHVQEEPQAK
jgi:hypothetical protein